MCVVEGLTSSLLTNAFRNRFILPQLLRPMLPDESMTNAISAIDLHSLSGENVQLDKLKLYQAMLLFYNSLSNIGREKDKGLLSANVNWCLKGCLNLIVVCFVQFALFFPLDRWWLNV